MKDVNGYCDATVSELGLWKARLYDVLRRLEKASSGDKAKVADQINDLYIVVDDMEARIGKLRTECPADWKTDQAELDQKFVHLKGLYNDLNASFSPGDIGG